LTVFAIDLFFASPATPPVATLSAAAFAAAPQSWRVMADLFLIGLFGGFYIVPLYALIQSRSEPQHRSRIIAGNNILNACFMVAAALASIGFIEAGLSIPQLILVAGLVNVAVALYIYRLVPEFLLRFIAWLLIHSIYRLEKVGLENVPDEGAAVVVCNHVSFADAVIVMGACRRPMRFVMDHRIFRTPILSFVFREGRAIPIAPAKEDPALNGARLRRGRGRARRRRDRGDLSRRRHHAHGRAATVPVGHHPHPGALARAGRSDCPVGPVGQFLQPAVQGTRTPRSAPSVLAYPPVRRSCGGPAWGDASASLRAGTRLTRKHALKLDRRRSGR